MLGFLGVTGLREVCSGPSVTVAVIQLLPSTTVTTITVTAITIPAIPIVISIIINTVFLPCFTYLLPKPQQDVLPAPQSIAGVKFIPWFSAYHDWLLSG